MEQTQEQYENEMRKSFQKLPEGSYCVECLWLEDGRGGICDMCGCCDGCCYCDDEDDDGGFDDWDYWDTDNICDDSESY